MEGRQTRCRSPGRRTDLTEVLDRWGHSGSPGRAGGFGQSLGQVWWRDCGEGEESGCRGRVKRRGGGV